MHESYIVPVFISGGVLFLLFLFFIVFYLYYHRKRIGELTQEKERLQYEYQVGLLSARLEEQERAMSQISREIHDNISQKIDFLQMNIKSVREAGVSPASVKPVENSLTLAEQIGIDLRNISYTLNGEYITAHGLNAILRKDLEYIQSAHSITCDLHVCGTQRDLPPEKELLIYRIAQEALHNCTRHARASGIQVSLDYTPDHFSLKIADDGAGLDQGSANFRDGLGLRNMQQRARMLDAELKVESDPGNGCTVSLKVYFE